MHRIVRYFLISTVLLLSAANAGSKYSEEDVTADFKAMLANPRTSAKVGEDFVTRVTRPFIARVKNDTRFLSDPKNWRVDWVEEYEAHTRQTSITPLKIFETMGIASRGILNDPSASRNKEIANEQQTGMLKIITGDLGFRQRAATEAEKETIARELLNLGRSRDSKDYAPKLKTLFDDSKSSAAIKKHAQLSALLMLMGSGGQIKDTEWYLAGLDKAATRAKIQRYADRFLPRDDAAAAAGAPSVPNNTRLANLSRKDMEASLGGSEFHSREMKQMAPKLHESGEGWRDEDLEFYFLNGIFNHYLNQFTGYDRGYDYDPSPEDTNYNQQTHQRKTIELLSKTILKQGKSVYDISSEEVITVSRLIQQAAAILQTNSTFVKLGIDFHRTKIQLEKLGAAIEHSMSAQKEQLYQELLGKDRQNQDLQAAIFYWMEEYFRQFILVIKGKKKRENEAEIKSIFTRLAAYEPTFMTWPVYNALKNIPVFEGPFVDVYRPVVRVR